MHRIYVVCVAMGNSKKPFKTRFIDPKIKPDNSPARATVTRSKSSKLALTNLTFKKRAEKSPRLFVNAQSGILSNSTQKACGRHTATVFGPLSGRQYKSPSRSPVISYKSWPFVVMIPMFPALGMFFPFKKYRE